MKKIISLLLIMVVLGACSKSSNHTTPADPYAGTFYIKTTVNKPWYVYNNVYPFMYPALGTAPEAWVITKTSNGQYTIAPTSGPSTGAIYNAGNGNIVTTGNATPLKPEELFNFEPVAGSTQLNIKSALDNSYFELQYGLDGSGNIIHWSIVSGNKTAPCSADFSSLYPPTVSTGCQFNFELQKP